MWIKKKISCSFDLGIWFFINNLISTVRSPSFYQFLHIIVTLNCTNIRCRKKMNWLVDDDFFFYRLSGPHHWKRKEILGLVCILFFTYHVWYLTRGRFDYGYNMKVNILVGEWVSWYLFSVFRSWMKVHEVTVWFDVVRWLSFFIFLCFLFFFNEKEGYLYYWISKGCVWFFNIK